MKHTMVAIAVLLAANTASFSQGADELARAFAAPPPSARPWVYWFWINGNISKEGITADLEAMKRVGIGGVLWMEVSGQWWAPAGQVVPLSPQWHECMQWAVRECERLGIEFDVSVDFGYSSGGPHITPELSMQKLSWIEKDLAGGQKVSLVLPRPETAKDLKPGDQIHKNSSQRISAQVREQIEKFDSYKDVAVLAIPAPDSPQARTFRIPDIHLKDGTLAWLPGAIRPMTKHDTNACVTPPPGSVTPSDRVVDLTGHMGSDGRLTWDAPPGNWQVIRFGHASNLKLTHPCPPAAIGLECDRLSPAGIETHFNAFLKKIIAGAGEAAGGTLAYTHIDSWEAGGQNWTAAFPAEFRSRRGYDLRPWLPVLTGRVVGSPELSERFLWDVRRTVDELMRENYAGRWGEHLQRHNTWWDYSRPWMDYLSRCQYLLQQGEFVADICYWFGEGAPLNLRDMKLDLPKGYDLDFCSAEVVLQMSVQQGRIVLPSGSSYHYLLLPNSDRMTVPLARKIRQLAKDGARILGQKHFTASPSFSDYPDGDTEVREINHLLTFRPIAEVFAADDLPPDFEGEGLRHIHRRVGETEIYFVSHQKNRMLDAVCTFRVAGKRPELWNPETGAIRDLPKFSEKDGRTAIPLRFEPMQSWFVVFRDSSRLAPRDDITGRNFLSRSERTTLSGPWQITFDPKWGGPGKPVTFATLEDWSKHSDPGIRYYSGTAVYRATFDEPAPVIRPPSLFLDLGSVEAMARVRLNGKDCGIAWKPPYLVDITDAIRAGGNDLEIDVVNLWINRMIGDEQLPLDGNWKDFERLMEWPDWFKTGNPRPSGRYTFTSCRHYQKDSPLVPSGLLGPVTIQTANSVAQEKKLPLPGEVFSLSGHAAFLIPGKPGAAGKVKPWVWYAPTLPGLPNKTEVWMFEQFRDAGIAIAGIDVGESYGSPAGRKLFTALYDELTANRGYSRKPVLLGRSRGGLMTLSWAAENPDKVAAFAGIYPVCNIASYPKVARAAGAYAMEPETLHARLAEHNPIERLAGLAKSKVPFFAIHGDNDKIVPLKANSALMKERYTALGGAMQLIVPPGQGHNLWTGFFRCEELVNFVKTHAKP